MNGLRQPSVSWPARGWCIALSLVFLLAFSYLMNAPGLSTSGAEFQRLSGAPTFDFMFGGYDAARMEQVLSAAGDRGRSVYRNFMLLDVLFPAIYALFWTGVFVRGTAGLTRRMQWIGVVPVVTAGIDYAENLFIWLAVRGYPEIPAWSAPVASLATRAKGASTIILLVCAIGLLAAAVIRRIRRP